MKSGSAIVRFVVLAVIALGIFGLQIALPVISYRSAVQRIDESVPRLHFPGEVIDSSVGNDYWSQRLRFDGFLDPQSVTTKPVAFVSAAICKDELILLIKKFEGSLRWENSAGSMARQRRVAIQENLNPDGTSLWICKPNEVVRVKLRTGEISTSGVLQDASGVASDGETQWWTPQEFGFDGGVFVAADRPAILDFCCLTELVEGKWRPTDQFALTTRL